MKVQVINKSKHPLPQYATEQSAGMDLRANLNEPITLKPLQRCLVLILGVCVCVCACVRACGGGEGRYYH